MLQHAQPKPIDKRPPFIADQVLERLCLPDSERSRLKEYLFGNTKLKVRKENGTWEEVSPWGHGETRNRVQLLTDLNLHRLCITTDAGFGKTKATEQAQILRQELHLGHITIRVDLASLPRKFDQFIETGTKSFLVTQLYIAHLAISKKKPPFSFKEKQDVLPILLSILRNAIQRAEFTLIVDGLDQIALEKGRRRAMALAEFLKTNPKCRCIVAGRRSAVYAYWSELFSDGTAHGSEWEFLSVQEFTDEHRKRFLGKRFDRLQELRAEALFVPRTLNILFNLSDERFERLRKAADAYWESVDQTLVQDFDPLFDEGRTNISRGLLIESLGLIAWQMIRDSDGNDTEIRAGEYGKFVEALHKKRNNLSDSTIHGSSLKTFCDVHMVELANINTQFVNFAFSSRRSIKKFKWQNKTLRDFFAAFYLCRCADADDIKWLRDHQTLRITDNKGNVEPRLSYLPDLYDLWRLIIDMPPAAWAGEDAYYHDNDSQLAIIGELFRPHDRKRACELMYWAWPNLLRRAGFDLRVDWTEADILQATQAAQVEASSGTTHKQVVQPARSIVDGFLSEFLAMSAPNHAKHAILHEDMLDHFRDCGSYAGLKFQCGHEDQVGNREHVRTLEEGFQICAYQVTNRLYKCFDEHHATWFNRDDGKYKYKDYSPYARGPVIYLSWYDAMMLATWSHSRLPTEWEWEYACRANKTRGDGHNARFCWGDDKDELESHAWVLKNSREIESTSVTENGAHAHTVGTRVDAHPFGLHDMLGNVWEWCSNRYAEGAFRSCRGGSFLNYTIYTRCSFRDLSVPSSADRDFGVRLARAELGKS